jgi:hypothetical protein
MSLFEKYTGCTLRGVEIRRIAWLEVRDSVMELGQVLDRLWLADKPQFIWNCDECGKQFEHTPVRVVAEKGARNVVGRTSNNRTQ